MLTMHYCCYGLKQPQGPVRPGKNLVQTLATYNAAFGQLRGPCCRKRDVQIHRQLCLATGPVDGSANHADGKRGDSGLSPSQDSDASVLNHGSGEAQAVAACGDIEEGPALTLGSAVLERMAKLRALDQYRELIVEAATATSPWARQFGLGPSEQQSGHHAAAAVEAVSAAGDDSALLLRGALLIARHRYPSLDEQNVYGMLDDMARRVSALLPADAEQRYPLRVVMAINRVMYHDFGFRGNEEDYGNADNSCINKVMERRVGIPITLSLVYAEVARRVGLPMRGLNLPGHFMLQPIRAAVPKAGHPPGAASAAAGTQAGQEPAEEDVAGPLEVMVDAFKSGEVCHPAEAEERISQLVGVPVRIDLRTLRESRPLSPRLFLLRMLGNLRSIYLTTQQVDPLLDVLKYMRATLTAVGPSEVADGPRGASPARLGPGRGPGRGASGSGGDLFDDPAAHTAACASLARDEGLCYFALRRYPECLETLRQYVRLAEGGQAPMTEEEAKTVSIVMEEARRRMTQQQQQ